VSAPAAAAPRLHPRNRGFRWSAPAPPHRILDAAQARAWNERGCFLLRDAFTPAEMAAVQAEIDPVEERVASVLRAHPDKKIFIAEDGNITFTVHMAARSPALRAFCQHRVFTDLCHDLIGPDVRLYWDQAVYKKPERPGVFPWHQDNGYTYLEPQQYLTCWVALTDATRENGCPWVAPGLHRLGTLAHTLTPHGWQCLDADPPDAEPIEAPAGSIVVFSSLTPHKTGPNLGGGVRKAYIVQFAPDGARAYRDGVSAQRQDDPERQFLVLRGGEPAA
jgi:ectoine hydroxylase-related dioxygenase (phytanoyl-CoA dioxygenase family)